MLEEVSEASTQCSITCVLDEEAPAGTLITVTDAAGTQILSQTVSTSFSAVILSDPLLMQGETYQVQIGEEEDAEQITLESTVSMTGSSQNSGMMGMMNGFPPGNMMMNGMAGNS